MSGKNGQKRRISKTAQKEHEHKSMSKRSNGNNIGVIFDCDGVLLDSMEAWHSLDDRMAERYGVELTAADRDYMTRATLAESSRYFHEVLGCGTSSAAIERELYDSMMTYYADEAQPRPGVLEFVEGLARLDVPMGVASSTASAQLRRGIEKTGLTSYMRSVYSVEDLNTSKREPLVYDTVRNVLGTPRERTWAFEDALYAIGTLMGAGFHSVGVYDSEVAGPAARLKEASDMLIMSFSDITADEFVERVTEFQMTSDYFG